MTISVFNETFVGISELKFQRISDDRVLNLPTPANFVIQENKQQKIQRTKSTQGRVVRASSFITGEEPSLVIEYSHAQPEIMAFRMGNQFETDTYEIRIARTLEITKTSFEGAEIGQLGHGMPADQAGTAASIRKAGALSTPLTRVPFNTFTAATTATFSQGADGALKFSEDLVAAKEIVSLVMPMQVTGLALGDGLVGAHRMVAHMVDTNNLVWVLIADNVTTNTEGSAFDPSAETMQLNFFLNNPPGACRAWNMYSTNQKVKCAY
jgi:hypothetical protein